MLQLSRFVHQLKREFSHGSQAREAEAGEEAGHSQKAGRTEDRQAQDIGSEEACEAEDGEETSPQSDQAEDHRSQAGGKTHEEGH